MRKCIVVAVDPARAHDAALEFAVGQARRRDGRIHLVVVMHPDVAGPRQMTELRLAGTELVQVAHEALFHCERYIAHWSDGVTVTTEVMHGQVVPSLVAVASEAETLVLGHHRMTSSHHLPARSVTHAVAARTTCPVYAVPDAWHELRDHPEPVLAAIEDEAAGGGVAAAAFAEARLSGSAVRVVRAWCYPDLDTDEESLLHGTGAEVSEALRRATANGLSDLVSLHRDVPCHVDVVHGPAAYSLIEASHHGRLLFIGRHRPAHHWGPQLGPVTRSVLGHAHCPVVVVDPHPSPSYDVDVAQASPTPVT